MFPDYAVASSDHSPGLKMDIAITLDRTIKSCEHSLSLEPSEARDFVCLIREVEKVFGGSRRY